MKHTLLFLLAFRQHATHLKRIGLIVLLLGITPFTLAEEAPYSVKYAVAKEYSKNNKIDEDYDFLQYFEDVLRLALEKSTTPYTLQPVPLNILVQGRTNLLLQDETIDVHWLTTNIEYETQLQPIRIPLLKGLIGWRLMLIHQDQQEQFSSLQSLDDLKTLNAGQGRGWTDTQILKSHKFKVVEATYKKSIMEMLVLKRIDYYPRSMLEIWSDLHYFKIPDIKADPLIALRYPLAMYFFVHKDNLQLKTMLEQGLNTAIDDGSFEQLFQHYFADVLTKANLASRKIFYLENPFMSEQTPLEDKRLWYRPLN